MSEAKAPIERIPKLGDAHLDAPAESAGGLGQATGNNPLSYDTSDFMKYAHQVSRGCPRRRHEDARGEELVGIVRRSSLHTSEIG
jgi:hypothetical protein